MNGIELVDSVTWNPHKMIGSPLQSTIFVTQRQAYIFSDQSSFKKERLNDAAFHKK